jgi:hypothetical protein
MTNRRPAWNKYEIGVNEQGRKRVRGLVCFLIMTPDNFPLFKLVRRKMKDACMAFEDAYGVDWDDATTEGYTVMKLFGTAVCKTHESLVSIDDWVEVIGEEEMAA